MATLAFNMTANTTTFYELPPLPTYTAVVRDDVLWFLPDLYVLTLAPTVSYWIMSTFFHIVDTYDFWPQYRLHTPAEISSRNRVTRSEVLRDVIFQQVLQAVVSIILGLTDPPQMTGTEEFDIAVWATRVRLAQRALPSMLGFLGFNASAISNNMASSHPLLAGVLAGGHYPFLTTSLAANDGTAPVAAFATWELFVAKIIYNVLIPGLQFAVATVFLDTWQYFLHRAMHMNKWLYTTLHSRHHRLYVPYAFGALYNHPVEGFLLDTVGAGAAYKLSTMSMRQGMLFFAFSSMKTVDDHCGYALPWDPLQHMSGNNATYHDIHHQSWGIKTNFAQPYFTFWDRILGTMWKGDTSLKYERSRVNAEKAVQVEATKATQAAST
ncbi:sphinganine C4-monooxygenase [Microdochium nivale]|nr:sphinganine C4-monooxygenase [Microdochium nivale]